MKKVTLQLTDDMLKRIEEHKQPGISINTAILTLIETGISKRNMNIALELYKKGEISLWKASEICNVSLHEMLEIINRSQKKSVNINKALLAKEIKKMESSIIKMKMMLTEINSRVKTIKTKI